MSCIVCSALPPPAKTALSAPMLRGAKGYACAYIVAQETLRLALSHIVGWEDTGGTPRWRCYMQMLLHVLVLPLCVALVAVVIAPLRRRTCPIAF